jgi:hypothetical protein
MRSTARPDPAVPRLAMPAALKRAGCAPAHVDSPLPERLFKGRFEPPRTCKVLGLHDDDYPAPAAQIVDAIRVLRLAPSCTA